MGTPRLGTSRIPIERVAVSAFTVPTDAPEADGTLHWDKTTMVVVEVSAGGHKGLGYTYADTATARLVHDKLAEVVKGYDALAVPAVHAAMVREVRNLGRPGIASMAISAVDVALWDLKARLFEVPLVTLLGGARDAVPIYGSGGFTSYSIERLCEQLGGWVAAGIGAVKMKVGEHPEADLERVRAARRAIGGEATLMVDANGAYGRKEALAMAERFAEVDVRWFEEPVSSDDLEGLRLLHDRAPAGMVIAAGEYGYDLPYFVRMLEAGAVDVLQVDITRCGGVTVFLQAGALTAARSLDLSGHTAPALHVHAACAVPRLRHLEYFHDHVRIENLLLDGTPQPRSGVLRPDVSRPGLGLELRRADAARYAV
ncbi:MAG TPA: enolase C-terminal domain-like protein [Polyangia bacterium]|jgi:L-alanine-DL-glutamate epimerase-like enolase superfamily enzyme|nr:enolase C-terminal domain-like protein [Polyangia bacterium]